MLFPFSGCKSFCDINFLTENKYDQKAFILINQSQIQRNKKHRATFLRSPHAFYLVAGHKSRLHDSLIVDE